MAKRTKGGRMSQTELDLRRYHKDLRLMKQVCRDSNINLLSHDDALNDDQCILSRDEYEIGAVKEYLTAQNEPYFVHPEQYNEIMTKFYHEETAEPLE